MQNIKISLQNCCCWHCWTMAVGCRLQKLFHPTTILLVHSGVSVRDNESTSLSDIWESDTCLGYQVISYFIWNPRLSLWSSGQSFWLQIQRSRVRFPAVPDFLRSSGLERGLLSLVRTTEEILERNRETGDRVIRCADHATPSNSPTSGGRSVCIVR
jgi:hypothetical protein